MLTSFASWFVIFCSLTSYSSISDTKVLRYYFNLGLQVSAFKKSSKLSVKTAGFCWTDVQMCFRLPGVLNVHPLRLTISMCRLAWWRWEYSSGSKALTPGGKQAGIYVWLFYFRLWWWFCFSCCRGWWINIVLSVKIRGGTWATLKKIYVLRQDIKDHLGWSEWFESSRTCTTVFRLVSTISLCSGNSCSAEELSLH